MAIKTGTQPPALSNQELVSCSYHIWGYFNYRGCNGGWMATPLLYIKARGVSTESFYPYRAANLVCDNYRAAIGGTYSIQGYSYLTPHGSCSALETYILNTGTVITAVTVNS